MRNFLFNTKAKRRIRCEAVRSRTDYFRSSVANACGTEVPVPNRGLEQAGRELCGNFANQNRAAKMLGRSNDRACGTDGGIDGQDRSGLPAESFACFAGNGHVDRRGFLTDL
jgi:hypothetical protein